MEPSVSAACGESVSECARAGLKCRAVCERGLTSRSLAEAGAAVGCKRSYWVVPIANRIGWDVRIHSPLVVQISWRNVTALLLCYRDQIRIARALVVVPHLGVLEERDIFLLKNLYQEITPARADRRQTDRCTLDVERAARLG